MNPHLKKTFVKAQINAYEALRSGLENFEREIPMNENCNLTPVLQAVMNDSVELFYVSNRLAMAKSLFGKKVIPTYIYSRSEAQEIKRKIDKIADEIIADLINDHQSDYDKALVLHDYLKTSAVYDMEAARYVPAFGGMGMPRNVAEAHSMVGALINKKCVCEGFAKAYKHLCDKVGVECIVITGDANSPMASGPHAWNIVKINGHYHHVDVTWDNQFGAVAEVDIPNYSYFGLDDEEISKDHTWIDSHYPKCPVAPYNYFRINNAIIDCKSQLNSFFKERTAYEEPLIAFKIKEGSQLDTPDFSITSYLNGILGTPYAKGVCQARTHYIPGKNIYFIEVSYR